MNASLAVAVLSVLALLLIVADPLMLFMPSSGQMLLLLIGAALTVLYAGFVIAERALDEREAAHRTVAGRAGFLAGIAALTAGLVAEGLMGAIDLWIPVALAAMIAAKAIARVWTDLRE